MGVHCKKVCVEVFLLDVDKKQPGIEPGTVKPCGYPYLFDQNVLGGQEEDFSCLELNLKKNYDIRHEVYTVVAKRGTNMGIKPMGDKLMCKLCRAC